MPSWPDFEPRGSQALGAGVNANGATLDGDSESKPPRMSFCCTCMGRAHHLKITLPANLSVLRRFPGSEIVVVDYNSPDDLDDWMRSAMTQAISHGTVAYYRTTEPSKFFMAHAKNVSHRAASGDIVCNLDADNILTVAFCDEILGRLRDSSEERLIASSSFGVTNGRTAMRNLPAHSASNGRRGAASLPNSVWPRWISR